MRRFSHPLLWLVFGLEIVAVAVIVHLATILVFPARAAHHDAFARVATLAPVDTLTSVQPATDAMTLPVRDAAMTLSICRFDLREGPLRITVDPLDAGLLSLGMHSKRGIAFYGLNLDSSDRDPISMLLMTAAQVAQAEEADAEDETHNDLRITAPEPEGFVTLETPNTELVVAAAALAHVHCAREGTNPSRASPKT